jgi:hypothetical protein
VHIIEQRGFCEIVFDYVGGVMNAFPPAGKVQQGMRVTEQRDFSDAANALAVQERLTQSTSRLLSCSTMRNGLRAGL